MAGALAVRLAEVHADAPAGGGVVGAAGTDAEHDLGLVARVEGGEAAQAAVHAAIALGPQARWCREGQVAQDDADGFFDEVWLEGACFGGRWRLGRRVSRFRWFDGSWYAGHGFLVMPGV